MNRILIEQSELGDEGELRLADDRAWHIRKVLRSEVGDDLRLGVIDGPTGLARVTSIGDGCVSLKAALSTPAILPRPLSVLLAVPRPRMINRILSSLASMGVARIWLTGSDRVEKSFFDSHALDPDTMRSHLVEGLMQSGRLTHLPETRIHPDLAAAVEGLCDRCEGSSRVLFDLSTEQRLTELNVGTETVIAIGPEGGWTSSELGLMQEQGFELCSMGDEIYRTDVACVAAVQMVKMLQGA